VDSEFSVINAHFFCESFPPQISISWDSLRPLHSSVIFFCFNCNSLSVPKIKPKSKTVICFCYYNRVEINMAILFLIPRSLPTFYSLCFDRIYVYPRRKRVTQVSILFFWHLFHRALYYELGLIRIVTPKMHAKDIDRPV